MSQQVYELQEDTLLLFEAVGYSALALFLWQAYQVKCFLRVHDFSKFAELFKPVFFEPAINCVVVATAIAEVSICNCCFLILPENLVVPSLSKWVRDESAKNSQNIRQEEIVGLVWYFPSAVNPLLFNNHNISLCQLFDFLC